MDIGMATIQTLGFTGQIFNGCLNSFQAYYKAQDLGRDALQLQITLEWTRSRLDMWGTLWGLDKQEHLKDKRFRQFGMMALNHLVYINYCLEEFKTMDDIFPTLGDASKYASTPAVSLARLSKSAEVTPDEMDALRNKMEQLQTSAAGKEKVKWALQDGKALKMAETVKAMVEDLYTQFPPPTAESSPIVKNSYAASDSLDTLDDAANSSSSGPELASLCKFKAENIRLHMETRTEKLQSSDPEKILAVLTETQMHKRADGTQDENRWLGRFREDGISYSIPVLTEHKKVDGNVATTSIIDTRIRNVARLLSMDSKPAELRTLNCLGVKISRNVPRTYRFIYELKSKTFFTLSDCLRTPTEKNLASLHRDKWPLEQKFSLATHLAQALQYFHLAGWLHKGLRSSNIIFCADTESQIDLSNPYIIGFDYSRGELARYETETVESTDNIEIAADAFRHPDTQGPPTDRAQFERKFDVYSLGMVLLDIGSKRSVPNLREKFGRMAERAPWSAEGFREWLLDEAIGSNVTGLAARMGSRYVEVVRTCLRGRFEGGYGGDGNVGFYMEVLRGLQRCRV
ncbi:Nn.00g112850.m01.CDS01 [Neocucurbitaria sp. VM-36]